MQKYEIKSWILREEIENYEIIVIMSLKSQNFVMI